MRSFAVLISVLVAVGIDHSSAFSPSRSLPLLQRTSQLHSSAVASSETEEAYKTLGVEEGKLALGITPGEVLENIGTREDLITKFIVEIPRFSRDEAEKEVDKFLMDGEMLDLYIKYQERKREDPDWEPVYAEQDNSPFAVFSRFISLYGVWILFAYLAKDSVIEFVAKAGVILPTLSLPSGGADEAAAVSAVIDSFLM